MSSLRLVIAGLLLAIAPLTYQHDQPRPPEPMSATVASRPVLATIEPTTTTTTPPPPPTTTSTEAPAPPTTKPQPALTVGDPNDPATWERLAGCETGGTFDWATNTGNGYWGGLQFSLSSWRSVGGTGYPHQATKATQIAMGQRLHAQGGWSHWPGCARQFGWI